jgi:hypothetical protein
MKTTKILLNCALFAATAITGLQPSSAKVLYVGADGHWAGKPSEDKYETPNAALSAAATGDEIWIAGGTYTLTTQLDLSSRRVSLYGSFAGTETSVGQRAKAADGQGWEFANPSALQADSMRAIYSSGGGGFTNNVTIDGLILQGNNKGAIKGLSWSTSAAATGSVLIKNCIVRGFGAAGSAGGGMLLDYSQTYSSFIVDSCLIENNQGTYGVGVRIEGEKTIRNSLIRNNIGNTYGAGVVVGTGTGTAGVTIAGCVIENNQATSYGGGIVVNSSTTAGTAGVTIAGCVVENNQATTYGGGIVVISDTSKKKTTTITGCLIQGNKAATYGGGIYIANHTQKINAYNCIVVNNTATGGTVGGGGGIYVSNSGTSGAAAVVTISNLTIANNTSEADGGGIYLYARPINIYNSIIYNNKKSGVLSNAHAYNSAGKVAVFKNNIMLSGSYNSYFLDESTFSEGSNIGITIDSTSLFGESWVTKPGSLAQDAGTNEIADLPEVDYAGNNRFLGIIDVGPYEYGSIDNVPPTAPANLTLKSASQTTLTLEWDKSVDESVVKTYTISVSSGATETLNLANLDESYGASERVCYLLTGLTANTPYTVSVQAIDGANNVSAAATGAFPTTDADDPVAVWYVGKGWQGKPFNRIKTTPNFAFTAAKAGEKIWIAGGEYAVTSQFNLSSKLMALYGGFAGTESSVGERQKVQNGKGWEFTHPTTLKPSGTITSMFSAGSPTASNDVSISIDGLILDGNKNNSRGIYWSAGTALPINVSIKNCVVRNFGSTATTAAGGGMNLVGTAAYSSFVVDSCLIENNVTTGNGGVNTEGAKTFKNSVIQNNAAGNGGGIYIYTATAADGAGLTITNCLIDGNKATTAGGGIYIRDLGAKHNIHNCIVVNNSAENGGGVYFYTANAASTIAKVSNLTIANNQATGSGGGMYLRANVGVYNSIFYNNRRGETVVNAYVGGQPLAFSNNIIDKDYSIAATSGCIYTSDSAAIFGEDWVTKLSSPGTDNGTSSVGANFTLPDVDYTGKARQVGVIDIGPYETFPAPSNFTGVPGGDVVMLMWDAVSGATSYKVYADTGSLSEAATLAVTVSTPYCKIIGLTPESQYTFTVKASIDPAGASTAQVTTLGATAPEAPDALTATAVTDASASLSWTLPANVSNISKYIVYANGVAVDSTADATGATAVVRGLLPWRDYVLIVRSKGSADGVLSASSAPCAIRTTDNTAPSAPVATLKSATKSALTIEWGASDDKGILAGYIIYVNGDSAGAIALADIEADVLHLMNGRFSYTVTGCAANTRYSVAVGARDEAGNLSELNADSLSTNDADDPRIWYVGKWTGKPSDRIRPTVNAAYTAIAGTTGAQLWVQGNHTLTAAITLSGAGVTDFSFYGGFAGYESSPEERVRIAGGKPWEFAHPTKLISASGNAIYSSATNPPLGDITIDGLTLEGVGAGNRRGIFWNISPATGSIAIRSCVIQNFGGDSSTYDGGGIQLAGDARHEPFVVEDCLIRNNKARNGGGICMDGYRVVRNCEIRNNSVAHRPASAAPEDEGDNVGVGGGVYVYGARGAASLTGCLIEGNSAYSGGGLFLRHVADSAAVANNVVVNNIAVYGGGVAFSGDTSASTAAKIAGFTIASNLATAQGGGVYFADSGQQVYNTILWNNLTAGAEGAYSVENAYAAPLADNLTLSHSIVDRSYSYAGLTQVGCVTETDSAQLFGAGWRTLFPSVAEDGGVRIPAAPATSIPATDMSGGQRVVGGSIDIGPYERQAEAGAPSVPQNLEGAPEGAGDILLTWQPSTPDGDEAVAGYLIYLNRALVDTVPAPDTAYTATGLLPGDYAIQVAAFSATGKASPKTPLDNVITLIEGEAYYVRITNVGEGITLISPTTPTSTVPSGDSLVITFALSDAYEKPAVLANGAAVGFALTDAGYAAVIKDEINVNVSLSASPKPIVTISVNPQIITLISPAATSFAVHTDSVVVIRFNLQQGYAEPVVTANEVSVEPVFGGGFYSATITVTGDVTVSLSATPAPPATGIEDVWGNDFVVSVIYYDLLGREVREPAISGIYLVREIYASKKSVVRKRLIIVK